MCIRRALLRAHAPFLIEVSGNGGMTIYIELLGNYVIFCKWSDTIINDGAERI